MIILLDNYDSFTWNLWHFLQELGSEVKIVKNDELSVDNIISMKPNGLVISPGPGIPENAGVTIELIKKAKSLFPIFGVCLGHQAINNAFGGKLLRVSPPIHGKLSKVEHNKKGVFKTLFQEKDESVSLKIPTEVHNHICIIKTNASTYCSYHENMKYTSIIHKKIDIYTQATSPIRRLVDLLNNIVKLSLKF